MKIYSIGDIHLSLSVDKPMDVFGGVWEGYMDKIKAGWLKTVTKEDCVLLPGDICWALTLDQAKIDLKWLDDLPGKKIITRGNHDYWWATLTKMTPLYDSIDFVHNNYIALGDTAICGSRGWICPNDTSFTEKDEVIYKREQSRLKLSLDKAVKDGYEKIILMLHYPPTNDQKDYSAFQEIIEAYPIQDVVYGHLHTKYCFNLSLMGQVNGRTYHLVSADYLTFVPKYIDTISL